MSYVCIVGISFTGLTRTLQNMYDDEKLRALKSTISGDEDIFREKLEIMSNYGCFKPPSTKYIRDVFMQEYRKKRKSMLSSIKQTTAETLSLDHTFRLRYRLLLMVSDIYC